MPTPSPSSMSAEELLALPPIVNLPTAARVLGIGRGTAYDLAGRGEFPVPVLRLGARWRVPTSGLLDLLGIKRPSTNAA